MAPTTPRLLTAYAFYAEATTEELRQAGRTRVPSAELAERWRSLSEGAKKPWEDKAAVVQDAYLQECTRHFLAAEDGEDGEGGGEEANDGGEEANEGEEANGIALGEEGEEGVDWRASTTVHLPTSRVKRIAQEHLENVGTVGREATFAMGKATEIFVERVTWGAARLMSRTQRKTLTMADLIGALKQHPCPEVTQFFVEELQPAPPPPPPKAKPASKKPSGKEDKKPGKNKKPPELADGGTADDGEAAPPPPKKARGRPRKVPAE